MLISTVGEKYCYQFSLKLLVPKTLLIPDLLAIRWIRLVNAAEASAKGNLRRELYKGIPA